MEMMRVQIYVCICDGFKELDPVGAEERNLSQTE